MSALIKRKGDENREIHLNYMKLSLHHTEIRLAQKN